VSTPYLSEIRILSFNFAPTGWALCNGQLLPINQNAALFSLLGTTYGGNGTTTFALPNLQARVPLQAGQGFALGQSGGEQAHTLTTSETPGHTHPVVGATTAGNSPVPAGNFLAAANQAYAPLTSAATTLTPATVGNAGGAQAHDNMQPYLVLNFCIALQGIYPSRN
jgi:microcystin-dependent protein